MVQFAQDGAPIEGCLNLELSFIKILNMYLKEVKHNDIVKNALILEAFLDSFKEIKVKMEK
jgi:hypothetical protein